MITAVIKTHMFCYEKVKP